MKYKILVTTRASNYGIDTKIIEFELKQQAEKAIEAIKIQDQNNSQIDIWQNRYQAIRLY